MRDWIAHKEEKKRVLLGRVGLPKCMGRMTDFGSERFEAASLLTWKDVK